jgi:gas vesicle protein
MKLSFWAGLAVGASIGLLITPKPGVDLRDDIRDFARENLNRETLESLVDEGRERIQPLINTVTQTTGELAHG